jgi:hypothetical protein
MKNRSAQSNGNNSIYYQAMLKDEEHHEHVSALPSIAKITQATPNLMAISPNMTHQLLDTIQKPQKSATTCDLYPLPSKQALQQFKLS